MGLNPKEMAQYTLIHYLTSYKYINNTIVGIHDIIYGKFSLHAHSHQSQLKQQAKAAVITPIYLLDHM